MLKPSKIHAFISLILLSGLTMGQNKGHYEKGYKKLVEVDGEAGEKVINELEKKSPELAKYIVEFVFGDVYSGDALPPDRKEIAVIAALTSLGTASPQLKVHLNAALNTGNTISEIQEVILQMSVYSGFPSSINAMNLFDEVIKERRSKGIHDPIGDQPKESNVNRAVRGKTLISLMDPKIANQLTSQFEGLSPDLVRYIWEYAYGDILSRDNLGLQKRQIATIASLAAMGNAEPQLKFHINAGLNIGLTHHHIEEIMLLMTVYVGFPSAINGMYTLHEVNEARQ